MDDRCWDHMPICIEHCLLRWYASKVPCELFCIVNALGVRFESSPDLIVIPRNASILPFGCSVKGASVRGLSVRLRSRSNRMAESNSIHAFNRGCAAAHVSLPTICISTADDTRLVPQLSNLRNYEYNSARYIQRGSFSVTWLQTPMA